MKYGMRERISGAVIIVALAVIFVPMLFDEPAPREERPAPVLTIEQPIEVERTAVAEPQPPAGLSEPAGSNEVPQIDVEQIIAATEPVEAQVDPIAELAQAAQSSDAPDEQGSPTQEQQAERAEQPEEQPISAAPSSSSVAVTPGGEWAVQVGSFGEAANAERFEAELDEQGFNAYRRDRGNDMTSVYVGPYASSDEGERARTELKERANIQGLLVRAQEGE